MGRYRKIDPRMHGDARFCRLTPCPPNPRYLWVYLLTGPDAGAFPGLIRKGEAGLAEDLGWPLKGLREAMAELLRERLVVVDWTARVIHLPNAIKYNEPESPNVVKSKAWRGAFDEIPECPLKVAGFERVRLHVEGMGKAFRQAFAEAFPEPFPKDYAESGTGTGAVTEEATSARARARSVHLQEQARELIEYVNELSGKSFPADKTSSAAAVQRIREHGEYVMAAMVRHRWHLWRLDDRMRPYFRPATLFRPQNAAQYIGDLPKAELEAARRKDREQVQPGPAGAQGAA